ncbi:GcrA family cell cycle regulator [Erythrobacter sp. HL-111]|uniref:GcrA family cell cycle regulator n=1 Tax=Erythrobacter sp. HL-111 TaxID=1798193 RepID=UPI0006DABC57|nr:GcrA family cell cycle regulator [Erythrobacter sp. HL-111]KPP83588.1 MAG: autonomous glycyl radical cofactor GrcA [Erythrobacteraceae bacterium HL-111]SDS29362.1 GcrA cell cycle regulator [Erythrobacter sp. HL-111]
MSWTDERIATLRKMWESGATASQIAEELGGVSRNAVIGKAHRLGLKSRPSPVKANDKKKPAPKKPAAKPAPAKKQDAAPARPQARAETAAPAAPEPARESASAPPAAKDAPARPDPGTAGDAGETPKEQNLPKIVSVGPGGFLRQGPGDQQAPIPPAPPRRLVPAKPSPEIADKTSLLDLSDKVCRWPMGHPGEPDFHFCGEPVNPGFPYCVEHCGRAYQAQLPRGARKPPPPLPFGGPRVR